MQRSDIAPIALAGLGIALVAGCGPTSGQVGVLTFSNNEVAGVIEAAGVPRGTVRTMRRNADRTGLNVEWITASGALVVQVVHTGDRRTMNISGRSTCPGWVCYPNGKGQVVAWLQAPSLGSPQVAHIGNSTISTDTLSLDPTGRYFAIQTRGRRLEIGESADPERRCLGSEASLEGVWAYASGPLVVGKARGSRTQTVIVEKYRIESNQCGLVARHEVTAPFEHFEVADYSSSPERLLVTELRDDPFCSRLWTWEIGGRSLKRGGCAMDVNFFAQ
jgi:hypothetical protein